MGRKEKELEMEQWNKMHDILIATLNKEKELYVGEKEEISRILDSIEYNKTIIGEDILTTEQWKSVRYSLKDILEESYIEYVARKRGIEDELRVFEMELKKKYSVIDKGLTDSDTIKVWKEMQLEKRNERIDFVSNLDLEETDNIDFVDVVEYVKYRRKKLFKMMDVFIENSKKKLHYEGKNEYRFNNKNFHFIKTLIDLYDEKNINCKKLLDRKYHELEEDFLIFIYTGLEDLAENKDTNLKLEDFKWKWKLLLNPYYKEICSIEEDLRANIIYYFGAVPETEENDDVYRSIKERLLSINEEIIKMTESRLEFPDLDKEADEKLKRIIKRSTERIGEELWEE